MDTHPHEPRQSVLSGAERRGASQGRPWLRCHCLRPAGVDWPAGVCLESSVERAQLVAITGPPGAGQSAVLRTIAGMDVPERGGVYFCGHPDWSLASSAARPGVVTPRLRLRPDFTVRENVAIAPLLEGLPPEFVERRAGAALAAAGLSHIAQTKASSLSAVDRERLILARELAVCPELLLLDDPYQALTPENRLEIGEALAAIVDELSTAVIYGCSRQDEIADRATMRLTLPPTGTGDGGAPCGESMPPFPKRLMEPGGQAPAIGMPLAIPLAGLAPAAPPARPIRQGPAWLAVEACWLSPDIKIARGAVLPEALGRARQVVLGLRMGGGSHLPGPAPGPAECGPTFPPMVDLLVQPSLRRPGRFRVRPGCGVTRPELWSPGSWVASVVDLASVDAGAAGGQLIRKGAHLILATWRGPQDDDALRRLARSGVAGGDCVVVPVLAPPTEASSWGDALAAVPHLYVLALPPAGPPEAAGAAIWHALEPRNTVLALPARRPGRPANLPAAAAELFGPAEQVLQVHAARRDTLAALGRAAAAVAAGNESPPPLLAAYWALLAGSFTLAGSLIAGSGGRGEDQP